MSFPPQKNEEYHESNLNPPDHQSPQLSGVKGILLYLSAARTAAIKHPERGLHRPVRRVVLCSNLLLYFRDNQVLESTEQRPSHFTRIHFQIGTGTEGHRIYRLLTLNLAPVLCFTWHCCILANLQDAIHTADCHGGFHHAGP